ncbi:MAG: hypothetical protein WCK78_05330 [Paludibacter sp.]
MYKIKPLALLFFAILITHSSHSQNNTNSPYTRFGFGDISDTNNGEQRAMGGVSIGTRNNTGINAVNPASYSSVDSMTFMFDLGASALMSHFSDSQGGVTKANGNLEYLTLQFPITKWLGFSAGALPYSFVGYNFYNNDTTYLNNLSSRDTIPCTKSFIGDGGFSQVYMGFSANLFKHVSLGVNAYYMFGTINNYRDLTSTLSGFTATSESNTLKANNFRFRYGVQFYNTFDKKHDVTLGLIYESKTSLKGSFKKTLSGVLVEPIDSSSNFETPQIFGLGLYYTYNKSLSIGVDYSLQQWNDVKFNSDNIGSLGNRSKLSIGLDFMPNPFGRKYSDHVHYRAGYNISDSYFNVYGQNLPKNYGFSVGIGLPLKNSSTVLNASLEYGKIGSLDLLKEDFYKLTFNFTFNEHWFFKRKL